MLCQCSIRSPNIPSLQLSTTASKYGKIFFRHSEGHIRDFELQTVTFGVNCAAFLAIWVQQRMSHVCRRRHFGSWIGSLGSLFESYKVLLIPRAFHYENWFLTTKKSSSYPKRSSTDHRLPRPSRIRNGDLPYKTPDPFPNCHAVWPSRLGRWAGWDDELPTELCQRWNSFLQIYSVLDQVEFQDGFPSVQGSALSIKNKSLLISSGYFLHFLIFLDKAEGKSIKKWKAKSFHLKHIIRGTCSVPQLTY